MAGKWIVCRGDVARRIVAVLERVALRIGGGIRIVLKGRIVIRCLTAIAVPIGDGGQVVVGVEAKGVSVLQRILRRGHVVVGGIEGGGEAVIERIIDRRHFEVTIVVVAGGVSRRIGDNGDATLVGERCRIAQRVGDGGDAVVAIVSNGCCIIAGIGDGG